MDQTQVAQIIQRLAAGEQIPGWSYHPEQTNLYGDSQYAQTEPTSAFYNGQGYWADGNPMRNQTLDLGDVAKLAAIMGTAYLGGTALAGSGTGAGTAAAAAPVTDAATAAFLEANMGALAPGAGASTGLLSQAGGVLSSAAEWMKANPTAGRLLMSGVSGLLSASGGSSGGSSGGYRDSGYRPTITRGNWQPSVTPRSMALTPTSINLPTTGNAGSGLWRYGLLGG